jgi:hypothetical protein
MQAAQAGADFTSRPGNRLLHCATKPGAPAVPPINGKGPTPRAARDALIARINASGPIPAYWRGGPMRWAGVRKRPP